MVHINRYAAIALTLLLAGCGGNSPTPVPVPYAGWAITESSAPRQIPAASFVFQNCASASVCWDSYVEHPAAGISGNLTLSWTIAGNPTFVNDSPGNTCGGVPSVSLLIRTPGRFFSLFALQTPLALGSFSMSVPLTVDKWINVDGGTFNPSTATTIGFGLGGGCYSAHGIAVSVGSATFTINGEGAN